MTVEVGRYVIHEEIAAGGMASVHLGRITGEGGFVRTVAIKRLHPHLARDPEFSTMFLDEARVAGRIRHPNVVPTLDVVSQAGELLLVMEYVDGESLSALLKATDALAPAIAVAIAIDALEGLEAAHEATSPEGTALAIVHRDVSPQNILVGADGVARVVDFGIAKAAGRMHTTRDGRVKGKAAYMAPEQLRGKPVDRRTDIYAAGIVIWEMLTGRRLFYGETPEESMNLILESAVSPPSKARPGVPPELDAIVLRALARDPAKRWETAGAFSRALGKAVSPASRRDVADWMKALAHQRLAERAEAVARVERDETDPMTPPTTPLIGVASSTDPSAVKHADAKTGTSRAVLGGGFALVVATVAGIFFATRRHAGIAAPPASAPIAVASAPSSETASAAAPSAVPAPTPAPASAVVTAKLGAKPKPPGVKRRPSCDPPYTVDPSGVRIPKPDCL